MSGEIKYSTRGFIEVEDKEFEYNAILYFGDTRRGDSIEIESIVDADQIFLEENREMLEEKALTHAHEQYRLGIQI